MWGVGYRVTARSTVGELSRYPKVVSASFLCVSLQALAASLKLDPSEVIVGSDSAEEEAERLRIGSRYKAFTRNLLSLSVLVQNRRKDKTKILVYAARTQLVSYANTREDLRKGRAEKDKFSTFSAQGCVRRCDLLARFMFDTIHIAIR